LKFRPRNLENFTFTCRSSNPKSNSLPIRCEISVTRRNSNLVPLLGRGKEFSQIFPITPEDSPKLNYSTVARKRRKTTVESGIFFCLRHSRSVRQSSMKTPTCRCVWNTGNVLIIVGWKATSSS